MKLKENEMSSLVTVCGACADNIQKHFDFITGGIQLDGQGSCAACFDDADLGFVPPERIELGNLEGVLYARLFTFEVKGFDLSRAGHLIGEFTEVGARINTADLFVKQKPQGHGECMVSVSDEHGYKISMHLGLDVILRYMAQFGRTKRGADNE